MKQSKYIFADIVFNIITPDEMEKEGMFSKFLCDGDEKIDCTVEVVRDRLPDRAGRPLFVSDRRSVFRKDDETLVFSSYFDMWERKYRDFACRTGSHEKFRLFVDYPGLLRERTVFDGMNLPELLLQRNTALLHSSFIEKDGEAILFTADRQVGKSTQAALWEKYNNARIINGDRSAVREINGTVCACGIPFCGTSGISLNETFPLKAMVVLSRGKENNIRRLTSGEAFRNLFGKFTCENWNQENMEKLLSLTESIINKVPVFYFSCRKDEDAVRTLERELWKI